MTLDTLQGYYFGRVHPTSDASTSLTLGPGIPSSQDQVPLGGAVTVLNGTGAGQVRRIVSWPNVSQSASTLIIDKPFDVALDATSFVSVSPYRGRVIWDDVNMSD